MTKSIRIDAEADEEISHAIDRYEREREGLGAEFWDELKAAMRTLEAPGPECGPVIGLPRQLGVRRKLLARFRTRLSSWRAMRSSASFLSCMVIGVPLTGVVVSEFGSRRNESTDTRGCSQTLAARKDLQGPASAALD
jgi:hypothetical protein